MSFATKPLPEKPDTVAPDGSLVRLLLEETRGSMAHFELAPGATSTAVVHRTVEELWFFLAGEGELWRRQGDYEAVVSVHRGVAISIPVGTRFQFRSVGTEALTAVGTTIPPWPGTEEAVVVAGKWTPTVPQKTR